MTITTPRAASSSVESMPENASAESAAIPPGPVMCTDSPSPPSPTSSRIESTADLIRSQPLASCVMGTKTSAAAGEVLLLKTGPRVSSPRTPCALSVLSCCTSSLILLISAAVSPSSRA